MIFTTQEEKDLYVAQAVERIALRNKLEAAEKSVAITKLALREQEQRNQDLLGIRNAIQAKLDASVSVEYVRPLLTALEHHLKSGMHCFHCERAIEAFHDKYPNLFTK